MDWVSCCECAGRGSCVCGDRGSAGRQRQLRQILASMKRKRIWHKIFTSVWIGLVVVKVLEVVVVSVVIVAVLVARDS